MEIALGSGAIASKGKNTFTGFVQLFMQRKAAGYAKLSAKMRNHTYNVVLHGAKMETSVAAFGEALELALELGKEAF